MVFHTWSYLCGTEAAELSLVSTKQEAVMLSSQNAVCETFNIHTSLKQDCCPRLCWTGLDQCSVKGHDKPVLMLRPFDTVPHAAVNLQP